MRRFPAVFVVFALSWWLSSGLVESTDWLHWRGAEQTGVARDTGLPASWTTKGENLLWKQPFGGRSAPVVSKGRVFIINGSGQGINEQERVMCFDAKSGKPLWEHKFNIFFTDIVTNRVGWANLAADPETGYVYAHGVQGLFFCFDPDGKVIWSRSLTEEYGRITGYGGRIGSPIVDEDLVIMNFLNSSWGDHGRGGQRFVAFDKKTGEVRWWSEPGGQPLDTMYSAPVVAVINGQRVLVCGSADGGVVGMKVRTGEKLWGAQFSKRALNTSPVVDGNLVYVTHSEENLDTTTQGGVYCFDASKISGGQPTLVWRKIGILAGYSSPIIHDGRIYACDNSARMHCLDAKTGEPIWDFKYGTVAKGSPVWADGKIYVGEVTSKFHILEPGDKRCKRLSRVEIPPGKNGEVLEINGSPAVADGRVFILTGEGLYCIGTPEGKAGSVPEGPKEAPADPNAKPAFLQIVPGEVVLAKGESATFKARAFDANGRFMKEVDAEWSLPQPPAPPTPPGGKPGPTPPPLKGEIGKDGKLTVEKAVPSQNGYVMAKAGDLRAQARVRVAPQIPYVQDFEKLPAGAVPGGWVNVGGKFTIVEKDGGKVLKKLANNANPLLARAIAYIGAPSLSDYTIQADLMGTKTANNNLPNMGVVNSRYSLWMDGNKQRLWLSSWEANHRIEQKVEFAMKPGTWYHFKLKVSVDSGKGVCLGKAWPKGEQEPAEWMIRLEDPIPNPSGSPGLYGYAFGITESAPGTEIFYDNVEITPNPPARMP